MSGVAPVQIDVSGLVRRTVATLYSHLVTRPTGSAVRMAIESQLAEAGETSCSLIDFSQVSVLDFSCADEVVAKLLVRYLEADRPQEAFFVFSGVERHREPIEAVLERRGLAAVARDEGGLELLGAKTPVEARVWMMLEERGRLGPEQLREFLPGAPEGAALERLIGRRVVFRSATGEVHALSRLVGGLP
jgi:hypothetical protein